MLSIQSYPGTFSFYTEAIFFIYLEKKSLRNLTRKYIENVLLFFINLYLIRNTSHSKICFQLHNEGWNIGTKNPWWNTINNDNIFWSICPSLPNLYYKRHFVKRKWKEDVRQLSPDFLEVSWLAPVLVKVGVAGNSKK
jgi:hypothetical protein